MKTESKILSFFALALTIAAGLASLSKPQFLVFVAIFGFVTLLLVADAKSTDLEKL